MQIQAFIENEVITILKNRIVDSPQNLIVLLSGDFNYDAYDEGDVEIIQQNLGSPRDLYEEFNMGLKEYTTKKIIELSDREKVLIERRSKEKDSKEREYISLQIKNVQDQLKYVVPKAMGFATFTGTTIAKAKSVIDLSKAFVTKSTELRESFNKNEITPDQYDAQYKKIKKAFDLKRASFVEKSKTDKKGESYTELQDLYDASLDENGKLKIFT